LSSRDDEIDRILGLELGADDYISKPFSPRELVARVKAVLRRTVTRDSSVGSTREKTQTGDVLESEVLTYGPLSLDTVRVQAYWGTELVDLTRTEFELVRALLGYPGKVYSRNELMERAYDHGTVVSDRTVDSHIRRVRAKFEAVGGNPIETVRGMGYKLGDGSGR
jgi:two-component system OmpR family response regulator